MSAALQDIRIDEPFMFELDAGQEGFFDDRNNSVYQGQKVYQQPNGKALIKYSGAEIGIGNRLAYLNPDVWYCIATPLGPGYFNRLDCFSPVYWQFQNKTPEEIMAFGAENPDDLEIYRMRILSTGDEEDGFKVGRV